MRWLAALGVVVLAVLGAAWFVSAFERIPAKEWVGPSGEATRNAYLAAQRFAQRMGMGIRELRALPDLDALDAGGVLLLPNRRQALDARRLRAIAAWVQSGGHLIVEAEFLGVADPLLDLVGVQRIRASDLGAKPAPLELDDGRRLSVSLFGDVRLRAQGNAAPARLITFPYGNGRVTGVSGLHFARNNLIGTGDNAELLWQLLTREPASQMQVYLRPERLSLWRFLNEHAAPVLVAAAALLALWLWRIAPRFGPLMADREPGRRRLLDHLRASGRYYWAKGLRGRLLGAARDAAFRRIARSQPDFPHAAAAERAARVSSLAAISRADAERFMNPAGEVRGAEFIRIVQTAQRIHRRLEKGGR